MTFEEFAKEREDIRSIGNYAVKTAQDNNLKNGIPNVYSKNGHVYYQMPNGTITDKDPFESHHFLLEQGFIFIFDQDIYIHKMRKIVMPRQWVDDHPKELKSEALITNQTIKFYDVEDIAQKEIKRLYFA